MAKKASSPSVRPLGTKVLLKRLEAEQTTAGGIVLPDAAREKPQRATSFCSWTKTTSWPSLAKLNQSKEPRHG
jgi:hypothetical protein